jgi:hypothetical protein
LQGERDAKTLRDVGEVRAAGCLIHTDPA